MSEFIEPSSILRELHARIQRIRPVKSTLLKNDTGEFIRLKPRGEAKAAGYRMNIRLGNAGYALSFREDCDHARVFERKHLRYEGMTIDRLYEEAICFIEAGCKLLPAGEPGIHAN